MHGIHPFEIFATEMYRSFYISYLDLLLVDILFTHLYFKYMS